MSIDTEASAVFSSPQHRAWLRRRLGMFGAPVGFILHNPSTASHDKDDPTSRPGIGFAHALDASDLIFVNAATGIATDADELARMEDPIGPFADEALQVAVDFCLSRGGLLIAAWGCPKGKVATRRLMAGRLEAIKALGLPLHHFRLTMGGYPEHLLYLPVHLRPRAWNYAGDVGQRAGRP